MSRLRWKVHECSSCGRWRSDGVMLSAGHGRHRYFQFVCAVCRSSRDNERSVEIALERWEEERSRVA